MSRGGDYDVSADFERRAERMKKQLTSSNTGDDDGPAHRETWMTELPPEMSKNFGLQSRQFSTKGGKADLGDRSIWTDTPQMRKEKESGSGSSGVKRKSDGMRISSGRDQQLQQQVEEYNEKKRPKSLLEMLLKNRRRKRKRRKRKRRKRKSGGRKKKK